MYNNLTAKESTQASRYEKTLYKAIDALPPDLSLDVCDWHTDVHVLPTAYKVAYSSVDVYVPKHRLCIMVDGEHHFRKHKRGNKKLTAESVAQQRIDHDFDVKALELGYRVLRLHYLDVKMFSTILFYNMRACRDGTTKWIDFSKHFTADRLADFKANLRVPRADENKPCNL